MEQLEILDRILRTTILFKEANIRTLTILFCLTALARLEAAAFPQDSGQRAFNGGVKPLQFMREDTIPVHEEAQLSLHAKVGDKKCMQDLGCFEITSDFFSLLRRPINVLPSDRAIINTRFGLFTKQNPRNSHLISAKDVNSFKNVGLNPKVSTIFIAHGFVERGFNEPWMIKMKDEYLMYEDHNVIIVDWTGGSKTPYFLATANTRVAGAEIALMVEALEKHADIKRKDVQIIGHSLGSHVAGYAGERLKGLGRITGLDPAGPYFENMPPSVQLDPTDSDFVDVIHTDAASKITFIGLGTNELVGHVDFFPNNGRKQPGCKTERFISIITDGLREGIKRFTTCNHLRSVDFMHYSINYNKITPVGYQCPSWEDFLNARCTDCGQDMTQCAIMGKRADEYKPNEKNPAKEAFFLQTDKKASFWQYHYQVTLKLYKSKKESYKDPSGIVDITLFGSKGDELYHIQPKSVTLSHGTQYQHLLTTSKELGHIKSVTLTWASTSLNPLKLIFKPSIHVEYISVVPMNTVEKSPRNMTGKVFCAKPENAIKPKSRPEFLPNKKCLSYLP